MGKRVLIETYGCTLNQADSRIMGALLKQNGFEVEYDACNGNTDHDYVVMNTCTVKTPTEQRILHRIKRRNWLGSRLIVAGCMASANQDRIEAVAPISSIVTTSNVHNIVSAINEIDAGRRAVFNSYQRVDKSSYPVDNSSVIARIPISEGCLSNCSFCETRFARGPLNSFSQESILKAIQIAVSNGAKEIELTSQDTGAYGLDRKTNIAELVSRASDLDGDFRIRIGMLNPEHLNRHFDELIACYSSEKVYKFLHVPVQSGSNRVLGWMKRRYTIEEFNERVKEIRKKVNEISIATDIIVGYPTESDEDFKETVRFLNEMKPEITNVSKFGARPHTPASESKPLENGVVKERSIIASRLVRAIQQEQRNALIGRVERVLITEKNKRSFTGRDDCYREVAVVNGSVGLGEFMNVKITNSSSGCLIAKTCDALLAKEL